MRYLDDISLIALGTEVMKFFHFAWRMCWEGGWGNFYTPSNTFSM